MARVERSETAGRGSAVVTRDASETRSGIPRRSIAPRIAVTTAGSGRTTNGRETGHARQARRRDATNSSRGAMRGRFGEARRATARQGARREETDPEGVLVYAERVGLTAPRHCRAVARRAKPDACWKARRKSLWLRREARRHDPQRRRNRRRTARLSGRGWFRWPQLSVPVPSGVREHVQRDVNGGQSSFAPSRVPSQECARTLPLELRRAARR